MGFHFNPNMFNTIRWSVWGQQIWALVGAVAALTTMAILLGKFNNRPVFNQMGITLNAIISILSVTIKAAVACILSECLAQWKWILYGREDRVLIDFDRLDGAARGPLGSLRVLLRTKRAHVAQFGAVLTLVAVALDPFAQQLLRLREDVTYRRSTNDTLALISSAYAYTLGIANIEEVYFNNATSDLVRNTIAMKDIDTLLWSMSIIYADISALKAAKALYSTNESPEVTWPTVPLKALECALYYCGKFVNSTVLKGRLKENITDVAGKRDKYSWASSNQFIDDSSDLLPEYRAPPDEIRSLEFHKLWSVARYQPLTIILNSKEQVTIQANSIKSIGAYIQGLFRWEPWFNNTKIRTELSRLPGMENAVGFNGASFGPVKDLLAIAQPPALNKLVSTSQSDFAGIARVFESMALSMTNEIRRTHQEIDVARDGMDTMAEKGLVVSTVVLYEVNWPWIALHVAILLLVCTLLLVTIIASQSSDAVPLWKSSSLAALRHGHDIGGLFNDSDKSVADMENTARRTYMSGRQIDVEETKHSGEQYTGLVESRRASQTYLDDEGMDSTTTNITYTERQLGNSITPPLPEREPKLSSRAQSHTF
ncbi:hypothetical protein K4K53_008408 [Colletotrichum sp. SAR 10_77]|nr:hypothetical protein K4K53_008408 [Colletotrichum sp. SAR 10_77]KAJ4999194.1 hypothetical protein K4K48_004464 [Colletotrichum sp. SAR 10_66]